MGSNKPKPTTFVKSCQDLDKSVGKPLAEYNPDDLIGRTFHLPPTQKDERHRASIKQKTIEISQKLDEDQNEHQLPVGCGSGEITSHHFLQPSVELP